MGIQPAQRVARWAPRWAIAAGAALCMSMLAACATAPVQEMSDARQAIRAAQNAGASQRAPDKLQNAQALLTSAEQSLQKRMYRAARRHAIAARNAAVEAMEASASQTSSVAPAQKR